MERANEIIQRLNSFQLKLLRQIDTERLSLRNSELYLGLLAFSREIINRFSLIVSLQQELLEKCGLDSDLPAKQAALQSMNKTGKNAANGPHLAGAVS